MALIRNRPFMEYLLDYLIGEGVDRVIFSVGYKSEHIQHHFKNQYRGCDIVYAVEKSLLGTGGAIKNSMQFVTSDHVIIVNGDSLFMTDLTQQFDLHIAQEADVTLGLKPMKNIERYGTVDIESSGRIQSFNEKQWTEEGFINAGVYIFRVASFMSIPFPERFSIEKDFFQTHLSQLNFYGCPHETYFLDIGIPSDFKKAQYEIGIFPKIDKTWTLFLDRDGVINKKRDNDYVKSLSELTLLPGAVEAIANLSEKFGRTIIVTNQQGIGKGLMTTDALDQIHDHIRKEVKSKGGRIDAIYFAPDLASQNPESRKPNIGMARQAKKDFADIEFTRSIMIGDSPSDMEFAERANMIGIMLSNEDSYDYSTKSLQQFSKLISAIPQMS